MEEENSYLVSDENPGIVIEDADDENDVLVTFKGKQYVGHKISIESDEEVEALLVQKLVSRLSELCELKHSSLIETCFILYSGSQKEDGVVPTMILCPIASKRFKTLNQLAFSLDQITLAKTIDDMASLLKLIHSKGFSHGDITADHIYFSETTKSYSIHPIGIVNSLVKANVLKSSSSFFISERDDVFQLSNTFRKMFLDYPNVSSLLSCSISYILDDCLAIEAMNRPSSARISDALHGIMIGFTSLQQEIDRLKKLVATSATTKSAAATLNAATGSPRPKNTNNITSNIKTVPIEAMHEKRANIGSFDRSVQLFKSRLQQVP